MDRQINLDELWVIGYILMGAAFADGTMDGEEAQTVVDIIDELLGEQETPPDLKPHLEAFDAASFDVVRAAGQLHLDGPNDRRALLALVARVLEADEVYDIREDHYIRRLGDALGATEEEYSVVTGELEVAWISSLDIVEVTAMADVPPVPGADFPRIPSISDIPGTTEPSGE